MPWLRMIIDSIYAKGNVGFKRLRFAEFQGVWIMVTNSSKINGRNFMVGGVSSDVNFKYVSFRRKLPKLLDVQAVFPLLFGANTVQDYC